MPIRVRWPVWCSNVTWESAGLLSADTVIVDDVEAFPGHIPCDARSRSEIVVPMIDAAGTPIGVLDVDSHRTGQFDEIDAEGYELIVKILQDKWNH
jgi:L-methionine (R)-S-oxide reductase